MIRSVWHGMWKCLCEFHVWWYCLGLWSRSHVEKPMSVGGPVDTYRTRSRVEGPSHACSVHMYSSCSLWAVKVNWEVSEIFTLANNFLRWTYFGPTRLIHPWTTLIHATLRVSVIGKCNSWLADITFDWRHVIVTAVERNNQTLRIITFLRRARFK